tara:strand:+ start:722 stop:2053 length:1332 start_codon:yes stop_codon:yes gene_type:complete
MKEEFYCLPLKKKVKAKITTVVKKKSYALKGVHKVGDKSYNLNKTCSKARAEEVAAALGIEIEHTAAAETIVPEGSFLPEGSGNVIGQNTAGTETAIPATEETPTANTTPFHSDSEDKIGPMSMAAESPPTGSDMIDAFAGPAIEKMIEEDDSDYEIDDYLLLIDGKIREVSGNTEMGVIEKEKPDSYHIVKIIGVKPYKIKTVDFGAEDEKKNCGCGKDPCITYGAEVSVGDNCPTCKKEIEEVAICSSCDTRSCMPCRDSGDWSYDEKLVSNDNSGDICGSCITKNADGYKKSRSSSDEEVLEGAMEDELENDVPEGFSPSDDKTVQFEDGTLMSPSKEAETGGVSYAIEPDHWLRLQAHRDWQATREEVNVERENNFWVITGPQESADDILDLIIDTADNTLADMTPVSSAGISKGVTLGIGMLGIAASIMLLQKFNKSD